MPSLRFYLSTLLVLVACARRGAIDTCVHATGTLVPLATGAHSIQTVFVIVMENRNWSSILESASAPYINHTMLPQGAHATRYFGMRHPSEPNYLWMEGGTDYGISDDADPASHHIAQKDHLVSLLDQAGISWRSYQEGIDGTSCPLQTHDLYAAKHNPFVFFDDVTQGLDAASPNCIRHVRPLTELATDLQSGNVPRYAFITPNLCNDMHGAPGCPSDSIASGDSWLAEWIPRIRASPAYASAAIIVTWDENEGGNDPIGFIVLSPFAKGAGYSNAVRYTHSSFLRSLQEIYGVGPLLCDAASATSIGDLFSSYP